MPEIQVTKGTIQYRDEGTGPPVVLIHGALVNGRVWERLVPALSGWARCIVAELPLGSHRIPMDPDADLSPPGLAQADLGAARPSRADRRHARRQRHRRGAVPARGRFLPGAHRQARPGQLRRVRELPARVVRRAGARLCAVSRRGGDARARRPGASRSARGSSTRMPADGRPGSGRAARSRGSIRCASTACAATS